jgi:hypothetical protein
MHENVQQQLNNGKIIVVENVYPLRGKGSGIFI